MNSSDAAESIVRMTLQGVEVAARITGEGAKNIAVLLYTMSKDKQMTKGKTNLNNMLKSGRPLKIFSLRESDLRKFHQEAKRYGVLYTAVTEKKHKLKDGMVDLYVREEDAPKVNRIIERFKLSAVDIAGIQSEIQKDKINEMLKDAKDRGIEIKSDEEKLADDIMTKPIQKENNEVQNPNVAKTEKSPLSEHSLGNKKDSGVASKTKKFSVRKKLNDIKEELKNKSVNDNKEKTLDKKDKINKANEKPTKNKRKKKTEKGR